MRSDGEWKQCLIGRLWKTEICWSPLGQDATSVTTYTLEEKINFQQVTDLNIKDKL